MKKKSILDDWDMVGIALKDMAESTVLKNRLEAKMNAEINTVKEKYERDSKACSDKISELETEIRLFVSEHKKEFDGCKSRELTFGRVGYRKSTEIITRNIKAIIEALKLHGMDDCINRTEKINKDVLGTYDDNAILAVGAKRKEKEKPFVECNLERLD